MKYISTRGTAPVLDFEGALLSGLARDGGLYLPERWPRLSADEIGALDGLSYPELGQRVIKPFVGEALSDDELARILNAAYESFDHAAVAPLKQLDRKLWLLELFHGPTLAFKDFALQVVGRLFDKVLTRRNERLTIVGATSGDTGSAAIEACRDRARIQIFMLHPEGRVTEVQRRQMTTVPSENVHNFAIQGSFDDCQDLVKALFNDEAFRDEVSLSAVNSINWARVMVQIVYYFAAAVALGAPQRRVAFAVPTGNFGNVYAGYGAGQMGLPLDRLVIGSNRNDILTRFLETGVMSLAPVEPSLSPSMDIQVSSNFERLLFDMAERDGAAVAALLEGFRRNGRFERAALPNLAPLEGFSGLKLDDQETLAEIRRLYRETGELIDPHSAIGIAAARKAERATGTPIVALATAHPAKFPDAVEEATGQRPKLPPRLADLFSRKERFKVMANDLAALQAEIRRVRALEKV
ncbi:MAG: threonine synthase [Pseudomonadota bacterium]